MVHVSNIFSVEDLELEISEGWVRKNPHPDFNLYILNYTEKTQYAKHWNPVTLSCRGLIVDADYNMIARPWKKFFNWGEVDSEVLPTTEFDVEITDKMDGSLGILYTYEGLPYIATRGSFASDQAMHATAKWATKYFDLDPDNFLTSKYTFLFEIVYPENRIVLDYKGMDDLVLLGMVNKETGQCYGPTDAAIALNWTGPVTQTFDTTEIADALNLQRTNAEGVVVRHQNTMVKIKQADYVALHKLVTGLNERAVWERLRDGESTESICDALPDEFHAWVEDVATDLLTKFHFNTRGFKLEYNRLIMELPEGYSRKDFALEAIKSSNKAYLFALIDNKPIDQMIWDAIKPEVN